VKDSGLTDVGGIFLLIFPAISEKYVLNELEISIGSVKA